MSKSNKKEWLNTPAPETDNAQDVQVVTDSTFVKQRVQSEEKRPNVNDESITIAEFTEQINTVTDKYNTFMRYLSDFAKLIGKDVSPEDIQGLANAPFVGAYLDDFIDNPEATISKYNSVAEALQSTLDLSRAALHEWEESKREFMKSSQWRALESAFDDIEPSDAEILLNYPEFIKELVKVLPEVKEEIAKHEKAHGCKLSFADLLRQAGNIEDAATPQEMLLSVLTARAAKSKMQHEEQQAIVSGELSKTHYSPNSILSISIRRGLIGAGGRDLPVDTKRDKYIYAQLEYDFSGDQIAVVDPNEKEQQQAYIIADEIKGSLLIKGAHSGINDAVREAFFTKILNAKNTGKNWHNIRFTAKNIWQEMNHSKSEPSQQAKEEITKEIEKARRLFGDLDLTAYGLIDPETNEPVNVVNENIFNLRRYTAGSGDNKYYIYQVKEYPLELKIAELTGQIISYPADLLDIREVEKTETGLKLTEVRIPATAGRTAITNNILRIVSNMKHQKKNAAESCRKYEARRLQSIKNKTANDKSRPEKDITDFLPIKNYNRVLFETLFEYAGVESDNRKINQRNREYCFKVLDNLQAKGYIKGYSVVTEKKAIRGVDIDL